MKKHNFNAGPSILPQYTLDQTSKAVLELDNIGLSILEISHRSKDFQKIVDDSVALVKELLNIPEGYQVLFLGGGASLQFCMVPTICLVRTRQLLISRPAHGRRKQSRKQKISVR